MKVYNHQIFVTSEGRDSINIGEKVEANGFFTEINQEKMNIEFEKIKECFATYSLNFNSKKTEVSEKIDQINVNINPNKIGVDLDDILDTENGGTEKLVFDIKNKKETHYFCISDIKNLKKNFYFLEELAISKSH